ncbi:universal stress protein [Streptomyces sp. NPDC000410]|uniref:universal stress protein n=1 Tax=Streptomyces sp. NPDC000410 TaxID=3154254 RepID=UPI00331BF184
MRAEAGGRRVVVGIDGSPASFAALRWAVDYARMAGAGVVSRRPSPCAGGQPRHPCGGVGRQHSQGHAVAGRPNARHHRAPAAFRAMPAWPRRRRRRSGRTRSRHW